MKKILGVSLVALMAVSTARADIASTAYVDAQDTAAISTAGTNAATAISNAIGELGSRDVQGVSTAYPDVKTYVDEKVAAAEAGAGNSYQQKIAAGTSGNVVTYSGTEGQFGNALTVTTVPTENSTNLITSGAVYTALAAKADSTDLNSYVPTTTSVNGAALSSDVTLDGADIALTGYAKGSDDSAVAAADTINAAIGKLENQIDGKQNTLDPTANTGNITGTNGISVSVVNDVLTIDGAGTAYTLTAAGASTLGGVSVAANSNITNSDGAISVADATDSVKGVVELATTAEAATGTDTTRAVTPAGLRTFGGTDTTSKDGTYVLTADLSNGVATYKWEEITRVTPAQP